MIRLSIIFLTLILLNSCSSGPEPSEVMIVPDPPQALYSEIAGNIATTEDMQNLRYRENVKGYTVGRYVDPADPSIMYEQNVIYRLEEPSSWNTQPNLPVSIPYEGTPRQLLTDDDRLLRAEIEVKAEEERKLYQYLKFSAQEAKKNTTVLKRVVAQSQVLIAQNKKQQELIQQKESQTQQLKADNDELKSELEKLIKYYKIKEEERIKNSRYRRK